MAKEVSSEDRIAESRMHSDDEWLAGGARGEPIPETTKERLELTDDQVAALKAHEATLTELDKLAATLPEKSDSSVIAKLQQELFETSAEIPGVKDAAKALHDQVQLLYLELNTLLEAWLVDPNHEIQAQQFKRELDEYWKKLGKADQRSAAAHPRMSRDIQQERQNEYIRILQKTADGFQNIKSLLTNSGKSRKGTQEKERSKDIGQLYAEAQSLLADITALVNRRRLAEKKGELPSLEVGETSLSELEAKNNWRMLAEDFIQYNDLAEMATVADRDKLLETMNFVIARLATIQKRLTPPPDKK